MGLSVSGAQKGGAGREGKGREGGGGGWVGLRVSAHLVFFSVAMSAVLAHLGLFLYVYTLSCE